MLSLKSSLYCLDWQDSGSDRTFSVMTDDSDAEERNVTLPNLSRF
jgi:hypothetical protein